MRDACLVGNKSFQLGDGRSSRRSQLKAVFDGAATFPTGPIRRQRPDHGDVDGQQRTARRAGRHPGTTGRRRRTGTAARDRQRDEQERVQFVSLAATVRTH